MPPDKVFVLLANSRKPDWMPAHDELGKLIYDKLTAAKSILK
jgi:hypothetical protein